MQNENLKPQQKSKLMLEALEKLGDLGDFGHLKNAVLQMYKCSQPHDELDHGETRAEIFHSFTCLYNFLVLMEMYHDPEVKHINILV